MVQGAILDQRALHDPVELRTVRGDRQAFHPAVGLASERVLRKLRIPDFGRRVDKKLVRDCDHPDALAGGQVELVNKCVNAKVLEFAVQNRSEIFEFLHSRTYKDAQLVGLWL